MLRGESYEFGLVAVLGSSESACKGNCMGFHVLPQRTRVPHNRRLNRCCDGLGHRFFPLVILLAPKRGQSLVALREGLYQARVDLVRSAAQQERHLRLVPL
jgi:hypothetical protein